MGGPRRVAAAARVRFQAYLARETHGGAVTEISAPSDRRDGRSRGDAPPAQCVLEAQSITSAAAAAEDRCSLAGAATTLRCRRGVDQQQGCFPRGVADADRVSSCWPSRPRSAHAAPRLRSCPRWRACPRCGIAGIGGVLAPEHAVALQRQGRARRWLGRSTGEKRAGPATSCASRLRRLGGWRVLDDVWRVGGGGLVGLIGPNGV